MKNSSDKARNANVQVHLMQEFQAVEKFLEDADQQWLKVDNGTLFWQEPL